MEWYGWILKGQGKWKRPDSIIHSNGALICHLRQCRLTKCCCYKVHLWLPEGREGGKGTLPLKRSLKEFRGLIGNFYILIVVMATHVWPPSFNISPKLHIDMGIWPGAMALVLLATQEADPGGLLEPESPRLTSPPAAHTPPCANRPWLPPTTHSPLFQWWSLSCVPRLLECSHWLMLNVTH